MNIKHKKPDWINKKIDFKVMHETERLISDLDLHTVCHQARCPNISECFSRGTATFLILGDRCTRRCGFCNIKNGIPGEAENDEPDRVLEAVIRLNLKYAIITSVTRDDLDDGGAGIFALIINNIKAFNKNIKVEVLTPDFKGEERSINRVIAEKPDVFGHNIETVPSLYRIKKGSDYQRSLRFIEYAKKKSKGTYTKSAIMLGLGEKEEEVIEVFEDLRKIKCDFLSIGQYLQPGKRSYPVKDYIKPEKFDYYKETAKKMGFLHVESGVYVRSSYKADSYLDNK